MKLIFPNSHNRNESVALRDGQVALDWQNVDAITARAAAAIRRDLGSSSKRIGIFARNAVEPVIACVSSLRAGVSPVPINFHLTPAECTYILSDADVGILFVGPENVEAGMSAASEQGVKIVVGWRCPKIEGLIDWEDWLASPDAGERLDMPARPYLHYTSGTTGRPKGTETPPSMFPQVDNVAGLFAAYRDMAEGLPGGPSMIIGPMYHTGPLNSVRHLIGGKPLVILERFDAEDVLRTIAQNRVSTVTMVPTHFQRLLALPEEVRSRYDMSSLRAVSHTGAACPPDVKRAMIAWFGAVLTESYGATEIGSMTMITAQEWLDHPGSVGRTQPGFELLVLDDGGNPVAEGEPGLLYFRDLSGIGVRYHNAPEKSRDAHIAPGVFTLGDIGYVNPEGFVYITDRESDMIVSGGVNIYPAEIEAALATHPDVVDSAVIGVPNAEMGEEVKALVIARNGALPTSESLLRHCREKLAGYKCPRSFEVVDDIGRNLMGKINKRALRAPYWPTGRTIGG